MPEARAKSGPSKSRLDAEGIPTVVQADTAGECGNILAWSGAGFRLLVREKDQIAACQALILPEEPRDESEATPEERKRRAERLLKALQKPR